MTTVTMTRDPEAKKPLESDALGQLAASVRRGWKLVAVLVVIFAVAGAAAGYARSPEYTAQSELTVGQASLATQSTAGYALAVQNLASVYSRVVTSSAVVVPAAKTAGVAPGDLASRVSGSPVPESSVFRIAVKASSAAAAIGQNRTVTTEATRYIARLSNNGVAATGLARNGYLRASRRAARKRLESRQLSDKTGSKRGSVEQIAELNAEAARFDLDATVWAARYQQSATPAEGDFKGAEVLSPAASATNDRSSWTQKLGLAGAAVGLLAGIALVSTLSSRRRRIETA